MGNSLPGRDTLAVAGTHGKTTTTTILAFLLQAAGREPGFLIGGVAEDFGVSARIGGGREFVVEADEYDTAFFDKRSKFVHYRPLVAILGDLEFDHRSEEHTSELQSLMRISYAVFCLKKNTNTY